MTRRHWLLAGWLVVLALSSVLPLTAVFRGIVHVGQSPLIVSNPDRPVIALGSDVVLPSGSRSVVLTALGDIQLHGVARDDLVALDGRVFLAPGSRVGADIVSVLGGTYRARKVQIEGRLGGPVRAWNGSQVPKHQRVASLLGNSVRLGLAAGLALLLVCTCVAIVFPWQIVLISTTLRKSPVRSVTAAAIAVLCFVFLVVPLGLSVAGLPFAVLLTAAGALAWLFGLTSFALVLGRLVARGPTSLLWATAAGLVLIALSMAIPLVGPAAVTAAGLIGAGALAVALISRASPVSPVA